MTSIIIEDPGTKGFISSVLGKVNPTNILTEYFACFRGHKKFKAYILSWLDKWIYIKLKQGKPPWVYVVCHELAADIGCCRDTVQRHLKELYDMGILKRLAFSRWATDRIWQYTINCERLLTRLFSNFTAAISKNSAFGILWIRLLSRNTETQSDESLNSDSRVSEFQPPTVEDQATYTSTSLDLLDPYTTDDSVEEEEEENVEEIQAAIANSLFMQEELKEEPIEETELSSQDKSSVGGKLEKINQASNQTDPTYTSAVVLPDGTSGSLRRSQTKNKNLLEVGAKNLIEDLRRDTLLFEKQGRPQAERSTQQDNSSELKEALKINPTDNGGYLSESEDLLNRSDLFLCAKCKTDPTKNVPLNFPASASLVTQDPRLKQITSNTRSDFYFQAPLKEFLRRLRLLRIPSTRQVESLIKKTPADQLWANILALEEEAATKGLDKPLAAFFACVKDNWQPRNDKQSWWERAAVALGRERRDRLISCVTELNRQLMVCFANGRQIPLNEATGMEWDAIAHSGGET